MFEAITKRIPGVVLLGSFVCLCIDTAITHPASTAIGLAGIWAGAFVFIICAISTACVVAGAIGGSPTEEEIYLASKTKWMGFAVVGFVLMAMGLTDFAWSFMLLAVLRFGARLWADSEL